MLQKQIESYLEESKNIITDKLVYDIYEVVNSLLYYHIYTAIETTGGNFFFFGNGGNVATVANAVCDINTHPYVSEDKSTPVDDTCRRIIAYNLCSDPAVITGIANDLGFEHVFSKQLETYRYLKNKVAIGISGSGTSKNIVNAFEKAKLMGMYTVLLTRNPQARDLAHSTIVVGEGCAESKFPGQTGKNNNNFHFEDYLSKVVHIFVGLLKEKVQEENAEQY